MQPVAHCLLNAHHPLMPCCLTAPPALTLLMQLARPFMDCFLGAERLIVLNDVKGAINNVVSPPESAALIYIFA
jgi:hypothetical protein